MAVPAGALRPAAPPASASTAAASPAAIKPCAARMPRIARAASNGRARQPRTARPAPRARSCSGQIAVFQAEDRAEGVVGEGHRFPPGVRTDRGAAEGHHGHLREEDGDVGKDIARAESQDEDRHRQQPERQRHRPGDQRALPGDVGKDKAAQAMGKKGSAARAASVKPERRAEIAKKAAAKRWGGSKHN